MAGIPLKKIVSAAFPGIDEEHMNQVCSLASNYHLDEVEFGFKLEALQVNGGYIQFTDRALGELKKMIINDTSKSHASNKENKRAQTVVKKEPVPEGSEPSVFSRRTDSGQVLVEFSGPASFPVGPDVPAVETLTVSPPGYFYNAPGIKLTKLKDRLNSFRQHFIDTYANEEIEDRVTKVSEIGLTTVGRITSEDGLKLSAANLCLQDFTRPVELDVTGIPDFLLYPGKIVAAVGRCNGLKFSADSFLPPNAGPKKEKDTQGSAHVVVACGPFTAVENLDYEPLLALLNLMKREPCGCLILCGPFLDASHPMFREETCPKSSVFGSDYTYEEAFDSLIQIVIRSKLGCEVIVVPSVQDLAQVTPVPQRPYTCFSAGSVKMVTNPCSFTLNGLLFGVSTVDVIREITTGSFSRSVHPVNRIKQAFNEILEQRSFLPFSPSEVPVDMQHADLLHLSASPDVLIVSSRMAKSVDILSGTVCINPGALTRGSEGGTYVRIQISAGEVSVSERTHVQIIQI